MWPTCAVSKCGSADLPDRHCQVGVCRSRFRGDIYTALGAHDDAAEWVGP